MCAGYWSVSPVQVLLAVLAMAFGAWVQGAVGFGGALVASPLLALVDVDLVPGPVIVASLLMNVLLMRRERAGAGDGAITWAMAGVLPGTVAAAGVLAVLSTRGLSIAFAVLVMVGVALTASGVAVRRSHATLLGAGATSGFMGTISGIGGPPVALLYQGDPPSLLRATLPRYFLVSGTIALVALVPAGRLGGDELVFAAALVPGVVLGLWLSPWLAAHADRRSARPWVLTLSGIAAVSVLAREIL